MKDNVIRLYDARPELALEQLKRTTGLDFEELPQNLADYIKKAQNIETTDSSQPPILTEIVEYPG